jgi:hypothetical protein
MAFSDKEAMFDPPKLLPLGSASCSTPGTATEVLSTPAAVGRSIKIYESPT